MLEDVDALERKLTLPIVRIAWVAAVVVAESRSERIKPFVPLWLTLDHSPCVDRTSTDVPADKVLIIVDDVDALCRRLTLPTVRRVVVVPGSPDVSKSDLIKPVVPLWVTLDQSPWTDNTSTDVPSGSVLIILAEVDALERRLTLPIVFSVAITSPVPDEEPPPPDDEPPEGAAAPAYLKKSDLI